MHDADFTNGNTLPHEVEIDLNVLGALMLDGVGAHVNGADVVTIDQRGAPEWSMKLEEQLSESCSLCNTIGYSPVFGLCTGPGHCVLTLRRPGDKIISKKDSIT